MRRSQHYAAETCHIFFVGHQLPIHPRSQDIVDPVAASLVDKVEHHAWQMESLGHAIEKIPVEHFPTEPFTDTLADDRSTRARLA
jgi:hypothetical protein